MPTKEELIHRWDNFLTKIENRFNESLEQAEAACLEQLQETDYDLYTVMGSMQGIDAQLRNLIKKIDETWHSTVQPEMRFVGDFWINEYHKGIELNEKLYAVHTKFNRNLDYKLAILSYDNMMLKATKHINCSQCNAEVAVRLDVFRAQYLTCKFCNAVNTFEPESNFQMLGWSVVDNIATVRAQKEYDAMNNALELIGSYRGQAPADYWDAYEKTYNAYWEKYFHERIKLNAEAADRLDADLARKKKEFNSYGEIQRN